MSGCDNAKRRGEEATAVIAAMGSFDQVFRVRHHAENVALGVDDASNVVQRAVRIGAICITENDLTVVFDGLKLIRIEEIVAVVVGDGAAQNGPCHRRG